MVLKFFLNVKGRRIVLLGLVHGLSRHKCEYIEYKPMPAQKFIHEININENHDLAIARSSFSCADPGLREAFKCLNV